MDQIMDPAAPAGRILPTADNAIIWWDSYLNIILLTSLFGGQITFTIIVNDIVDPATLHPIGVNFQTRPTFGKEMVRLFVSISWLLFMLALGTSLIAKSQLSDPGVRDALLARGPERLKTIHSVLTFILNGLPLAAIALLALVVTAYVPCVGWVCVGFLALFAFGILVLWVLFDLRGARKVLRWGKRVVEAHER